MTIPHVIKCRALDQLNAAPGNTPKVLGSAFAGIDEALNSICRRFGGARALELAFELGALSGSVGWTLAAGDPDPPGPLALHAII
jgi:hypothetical protein